MSYKKLLTFSFDDGITQDIRFIEILNKYGLKGTFNLNSSLLGTESELIVSGQKVPHIKVNAQDVRHIYSGHEIAAHTLTHPFLPDCDEDEIVRQVEEDRKILSYIADYEVVGFAYPGGGKNYNEHVAEVIKKNTGVKYARTTAVTESFTEKSDIYMFKPTVSLTKDSDKIFRMIDDFLLFEAEDYALFYIWGHSYELDAGDRWSYFEEVCKALSGHKDVCYCTNKEAFELMGDI